MVPLEAFIGIGIDEITCNHPPGLPILLGSWLPFEGLQQLEELLALDCSTAIAILAFNPYSCQFMWFSVGFLLVF